MSESTEWCVWWGGEDPNDCAGLLSYDDQPEAEEMTQWIAGGQVAYRAVTRAEWRTVPDGHEVRDGHTEGARTEGTECDATALDRIAELLAADARGEWGPELSEAIGEILRGTGRNQEAGR